MSNKSINEYFSVIGKFLKGSDVAFKNTLIKDVVQNYSFLVISNISDLDEKEKNNLIQKVKESKLMIIKQIEEAMKKYLVFGFEKTLVIHEHSSLTASFLRMIYYYNPKISVCYLQNQNNSNEPNDIPKEIKKIKVDERFEEEIKNFQTFISHNICFSSGNETMKKIWKGIVPCITAYLIKKGYYGLNQNRIKQFILDVKNKTVPEIISKDDYIIQNHNLFSVLFIMKANM